MKWSYRIARVAGIDVRVHATFLLLLAWYGYVGYLDEGAAAAVSGIIFILLLFLCVTLHEFGHAFAARAFGIRTPDITLLPIGGVARLERMPENPVQELLVAIAGPAVNVVIAGVLFLVVGWRINWEDFTLAADAGTTLAMRLLAVNVMLILFNMIPAFPMDGGRVLRALLATQLDYARATRVAARVGQVAAGIFVLIGIFGIPGVWSSNPFLLFIGFFIFMGAQQEAEVASMRAATTGLRVGDAMISRFQTFPETMSVGVAAEDALHDTQPIYPITDDRLRLVGMLPRNALLQAASGVTSASVGSLATTLPAVQSGASFQEAFQLMQESGSPVLPVVNPAGQVIGMVSLNLISERVKFAH